MDLLSISCNERAEILKHYGVSEEQVKEDVELIKSWKQKQPHLPENTSDDFIARVLLRNKFRVERTKEKLDNYYTLRGYHDALVRDFENIVPSKHFITHLPLPKLTPNYERVIIMKLINTDIEVYDMLELIKLDLAVTEVTMQYDGSIGVRYVIDFGGFTLRHLAKWNPLLLNKHVTLIEKAYSCRIMGFHCINVPDFATNILGLLKIVLRAKIYDKLKINSSLESLYEVIPKECLPSEYGGSCSNIPSLLKKWDEVFQNHRNFFVENYKNVSMEHLRTADLDKSDSFGPDGTFKRLTID
ncbi:hypothetical protein Zmor_026470 [Zophobas morio]|uniref:CRAL-TRIO domain-containing protein n=1 Tax=Zophobas morio TaxID=2755281 RepID=A0AA38HWB5_9CUCU|nr:hypothetical protein Zmor_026470 [Zophobas morio]